MNPPRCFASYRRLITILCVGGLLVSPGSAAQDLNALAASAKSDAEKALVELAEARKAVEGERVPLAREITALEQQLIDRRAELGKSQRFQENQLVELNALKAESRRRGEEVKFIDSLLTEYARAFQSRLHFVEEILYERILAARTKLERGIPFLALTATTGPLLGLLGTVMGMIATFKLISSFGSGDPKVLAAGISEALIATASGMTVAIPSLLFHAFLNRMAKGIIGSMEQTSVGFINGVPEKPELSLR